MDTMRERVAIELARWRYGVTTTKPNQVELIEADAIMAIVAEDREKLVKALEEYVVHSDTCMRRQIGTVSADPECTCGFYAALASVGK